MSATGLRDTAGDADRDTDRDTDRDWELIARDLPYYGVYTDPRFAHVGGALPPALEAVYFDTGRVDIEHIVTKGGRHFALPKRFERALDFGSGVGRLTRAMAQHARTITGIEITQGLLERARNHAPAADYVRRVDELPDAARYDWINSLVVFQHIPTARGMAIFEQLLERAASDCFLSLHFCTRPVPAPPDAPEGTMLMFGYDPTELLARLSAHGFHEIVVEYLDHGGNATLRILAVRGDFVRS